MMISVDEDIKELLREEENMSGLIGDLLHNHYHETVNFKRIRIMNKIKLLKNQKKEIEIEEARLSSEVELFLEAQKGGNTNEQRTTESIGKVEEERRNTPEESTDTKGLGTGETKTE